MVRLFCCDKDSTAISARSLALNGALGWSSEVFDTAEVKSEGLKAFYFPGQGLDVLWFIAKKVPKMISEGKKLGRNWRIKIVITD